MHDDDKILAEITKVFKFLNQLILNVRIFAIINIVIACAIVTFIIVVIIIIVIIIIIFINIVVFVVDDCVIIIYIVVVIIVFIISIVMIMDESCRGLPYADHVSPGEVCLGVLGAQRYWEPLVHQIKAVAPQSAELRVPRRGFVELPVGMQIIPA